MSVIGRHGVPERAPCSGDAANKELARGATEIHVVRKASAASKRREQTALTQTPCWAETEKVSGLVVVVAHCDRRVYANLERGRVCFWRGQSSRRRVDGRQCVVWRISGEWVVECWSASASARCGCGWIESGRARLRSTRSSCKRGTACQHRRQNRHRSRRLLEAFLPE